MKKKIKKKIGKIFMRVDSWLWRKADAESFYGDSYINWRVVGNKFFKWYFCNGYWS